jgi:Flp pilus assembly protein TadD
VGAPALSGASFLAMKLTYLFLLALPIFAQQSEFTAGRSSFQAGEFKAAIAHFQRVLQDNPNDGASAYWIGRSYETLADISTFGRGHRAKARVYLTKAVELAPKQPEYRRELFHFLVDNDHLQQAWEVLAAAESDPEYDAMLNRFREARRRDSSLDGRVTKAFQLVTAWQ